MRELEYGASSYLKSITGPQPPQLIPRDLNQASEFYDKLIKWIGDFDSSLDDAHEVGVRLVSFGQNVTFRLHSMGFWNPSLMKFIGTMEDGTSVELIQHVSQISILLMTIPRLDLSKPKRPIGFAIDSKESGAGA